MALGGRQRRGDTVSQPRRNFLWVGSAALTAGLFSGVQSIFGQRRGMPSPPEPADPRQDTVGNSNKRISQTAVLKQNEKEFRESLVSLYEQVGQLKQEVEVLHSADVFSVKIYKRTTEIEKLAKRLKTLAKG
jgi:hypothetical protein